MTSSIRTFTFHDSSLPSIATSSSPLTSPLTLALSRKAATYLLVHSQSINSSSPKERQWTIINALASTDPIPELNPENGRVRIWLKVGQHGRGESEVGGENWELLEKLVEAGVVLDTGIKSEQGLNSYPLVEILIPLAELCQFCSSCGDFESVKEGELRFKRCNRCKEAYYCSAVCQAKDWKSNHKAICLDQPNENERSLEEARRKGLLRLYGRATPSLEPSGIRSKMD